MDRLKPAFVDLEHPVELLEPRHCGWPLNKDHSVVQLSLNIDITIPVHQIGSSI